MPHTKISPSNHAYDFINKRVPGFKAKLGLILGSGLGNVADQIANAVRIPYNEIPFFPISTVIGHAGNLVLGELNGLPVVCCQGRVHGYEGATGDDFKTFIRTIKLLGCETLLITNSSGSLRKEIGPGELVLITDQINFQRFNPLVGPNDDEFGPRFFPMDDAFDKQLNQCFHQVAKRLQIPLAEGVYMGVSGPNFETPAEIRAFRTLGADVIGMSTVPEVIVARHCGLRVAAVSVITNFAAGMSDEQITHEGTLHYGKLGSERLADLLVAVINEIGSDPQT